MESTHRPEPSRTNPGNNEKIVETSTEALDKPDINNKLLQEQTSQAAASSDYANLDDGYTVQKGSESDLGSDVPGSHEDIADLVDPDVSQSASQSSSMQDMGNYFSPRLPDSTHDLTLPQTPPTPITELREWPPELHPSHDRLSPAVDQPKAEPDSQQVAGHEIDWRVSSQETVIGPSMARAATVRPTSVPILNSRTSSKKRRDAPDYPVYPDQSFAALQSQQHTRPNQPHPLRTRSSHPSNSSFSSVTSKQSHDFATQVGAKTVGNTPAQSPGLFSPTLPRGRSDELNKLHASHLQTPTETHKLLKDFDPISGRKLINDYELIQKLGSGQHGTVKLGKNLVTHDLVAVKIVRRFSKKVRLGRGGNPDDMIKKEVAILKKARHSNVVSLIEVIDDAEWEKVYLVLEFVARGEIVWRKLADKDVAVFEMNRVKREKSLLSGYSLDKEEVELFNASVPTRRIERQQALQKHKVSSFWSLEHGGESDGEAERYLGEHHRPFPSAIAFPSMVHELATAVKIESPEEELTPRQIPRSVPSDTTNAVATADSPNSAIGAAQDPKPETLARLNGTMYGAYDTPETASEMAYNTKLEEIFAAHTHWSEEEEEYQYVPCLTLSQAQDAFRDTVLGLEYLHYQGIIHRDIKPANLLWTQDFRVKISDFGVSYLGKPIREDADHGEIPEADAAIQKEAIELAKTVGTPAFYAPELCDPELFDLEKNPQRPQITGQIDVWALGVTLYCMIYGRLPFIDQNEMAMYEKIAREDVFISQIRLKGVEKSEDTVTTNSNKRDDDVVEYEEVDEELQDLLRRLLEKAPDKRITIKEVKQHAWVLRGIQDQGAWVDETDPSVQSEGKKIEVSNEDVQYAIGGLVDKFKNAVTSTFRRFGSVARGRDGRKRTDSSSKPPESPSSAPSSRGGDSYQKGRRSSLRGDEQIFTALRASRESSEHPLSQSLTASPELRNDRSYFESENQYGQSKSDTPDTARPSFPERNLSNTDSIRTVVPGIQSTDSSMTTMRPAIPSTERLGRASPPFSSMTTLLVDEPPATRLGGLLGIAGPRFANSMRSRERESRRDSPAHSSRSSSASGSTFGLEDPHASPSIAMSSAVAAGHVDQPPALREPSPAPSLASQRTHFRARSESEVYRQAREPDHVRQVLEPAREEPRFSVVRHTVVDAPGPQSPDDVFSAQVAISSSSDQIGSAVSESFSHPSIPSIVSGASSVSTSMTGFPTPEKATPSAVPRNVSNASSTQVDEAGYNGGGEQDSDSDEDVLVMGGKK